MNNKYEVLVIEDEENINNLVATLLEANGYTAISAYSGGSAKMLCSSRRPDLIILDLGLPDMDGITLLRDIRRNSFVPIIVLSARQGLRTRFGRKRLCYKAIRKCRAYGARSLGAAHNQTERRHDSRG